jgi:SulP family sulfate permease
MRPVINMALHPSIQFFPLQASLSGYSVDLLRRDAKAAAFVSAVAFIQGMACAFIAGLPIQYGLTSAIAASIVGGVFSGSRVLIIGPTNAIAILVLSTMASLDLNPEQRAIAVPTLLVMTGFILLAASWFRIAHLTQYISRSVVIAYLTGAAALIATSQIQHVLGYDLPDSGILLDTMVRTAKHVTHTYWPSLTVAGLTLAVFAAVQLRVPRIPASVVAFVFGCGAAAVCEALGYPLGRVTDELPDVIPGQSLEISFELISRLSRVALALALLSFLEISIIGKTNAAKTGARFDGNQHMYAIGLSNLATGVLSGMPVSGSYTRSRLNLDNGAVTPVAAILSGVFCSALALAARPLIPEITSAVLAAVVIGITATLYNRHYLTVILRSSRSDGIVLVVTLGSCCFFPLDVAIYAGAGLSIVFFLRKVGVPELVEYAFNPEGELAEIPKTRQRPQPEISIVHVEGDLFFGSAEIFLDQARRFFEDPNLKVIVLRMKNAHHLDATCAIAIRQLLEFADKNNRHIIVSGAHRQIYRVFRNSGLLDLIGRRNFFMDIPSKATLSTRNALKRAQELLGQKAANIRIYVDAAKKNSEKGNANEPSKSN